MIKAIGNKFIDLSQQEYDYYLTLKATFKDDDFSGLFEADNNGIVQFVKPKSDQPTSFVLIFFFINVMFNQRLRSLEKFTDRISSLEERIDLLSKKEDA